jgi:hypothetical protein
LARRAIALRFAVASRRHRRLFWSGPEQPAVVGVGAACSVGCGVGSQSAFCGDVWPGLVAWSGPLLYTGGAARQDAALLIRGGAIDLAHSFVAISVRSAYSATPGAGRRPVWAETARCRGRCWTPTAMAAATSSCTTATSPSPAEIRHELCCWEARPRSLSATRRWSGSVSRLTSMGLRRMCR